MIRSRHGGDDPSDGGSRRRGRGCRRGWRFRASAARNHVSHSQGYFCSFGLTLIRCLFANSTFVCNKKCVCMCIYKQHTLILHNVCYTIISDICLPEITTLVWICFLYSSGLLKPCCIFWRGTSAQGCLDFLWRWRMLGYWYVASPLLLWRRVNDFPVSVTYRPFLCLFSNWAWIRILNLKLQTVSKTRSFEVRHENWLADCKNMKCFRRAFKCICCCQEKYNCGFIAPVIGFVCFHHHILILTV